jgi:hypothetical protein
MRIDQRFVFWRGRHKLHRWLTYLAEEMPEAGLAPCKFGGINCECQRIAYPAYYSNYPYSAAKRP